MGRVLAGVLCLAAGVLIGLGDLFLVVWNLVSGGGPDIRARGPFLLAFALPQIALTAAIVSLGVTLFATRHRTVPLLARVAAPVLVTALLLVVLYLDPTMTVWRALRPVRSVLHLWGSLALDAALVVLALRLLRERLAPVPRDLTSSPP